MVSYFQSPLMSIYDTASKKFNLSMTLVHMNHGREKMLNLNTTSLSTFVFGLVTLIL